MYFHRFLSKHILFPNEFRTFSTSIHARIALICKSHTIVSDFHTLFEAESIFHSCLLRLGWSQQYYLLWMCTHCRNLFKMFCLRVSPPPQKVCSGPTAALRQPCMSSPAVAQQLSSSSPAALQELYRSPTAALQDFCRSFTGALQEFCRSPAGAQRQLYGSPAVQEL